MPVVQDGLRHVYYAHALTYNEEATGVARDAIVKAIRAELPACELREADGALISQGYVRPLYLLPMFQKLIGYGNKQCPFKCPHYTGKPDYDQGICPNAEKAHFQSLIAHEFMRPAMSRSDLNDVISAFRKVWSNLAILRAEFGN
jgi:dTDP-4-amino-4,6-dideoxygalactose transaminase